MSSPFRWAAPLPDFATPDCAGAIAAVRLAASQGLQAAEVLWNRLHDFEDDQLDRIAAAADEAGLAVEALHLPFGVPLESPRLSLRRSAIDQCIRAMHQAARFGARVQVFHMTNRAAETPAATRTLACESIEALLPVAEQLDQVIAVENMLPHHPFAARPGELVEVVRQFDHPRVRVVFDSGHAHVAGWVTELLDELAPWIVHWHLHDNDGTRDLHLQCGYGTTRWDEVFGRVAAVPLDRAVYVEAQPWGGATYDVMLRELDALANTCLGRDASPRLASDAQGRWLRDPRTGRLIVEG